MNQTIEIKPIDTTEAVKAQAQADLMLNNAKQIIISNQNQYEQSAFFLKTIKDKFRQLDDMRKRITQPLDQAKKAVMDLFRRPLECLKQAENMVDQLMIDYHSEQEQIRRDQERKLQAEAERRRLDAQKKADIARANGNELKAEKYEEKANSMIAPNLATRVQEVEGLTEKSYWTYEIIDETLIPRDFLCIDGVKIGLHARTWKDSKPIPGVKIFSKKSMARTR